MYSRILKDSVVQLIVNIFNVFFCLLLLFLCLVGKKRFHFNNSSIWFCMFSLLTGLWSLNATPWMTLMCSNRTATNFMEFILLMLMPSTAVLYIRDVFEAEERKTLLSSFLVLAGCLNTAVLTILHLTRTLEFKETATCTHLLIAIVLLYAFFSLIRNTRLNGLNRTTTVAIVSLSLLAVFYTADIIVYYVGNMTIDFGWVGISACLLVMGTNVFMEMFSGVELTQRNEAYREMAVRDVDTGLFNRNAYNIWLEETPPKDGLFIITFDLNELKHCNDVHGHLAGDQYIRDAASLFKELFDEYGRTFRLGGDEFITILSDQTEQWVKEKLRALESKMESYNETSDVIHMQIAYGYAMFDPIYDQNYEQTRHRADEKMYVKKAEMKMRKASD